MKITKTKLSALLLSVTALGAVSASALPEFIKAQRAISSSSSTLIINISEFEEPSGQVLVALFKSEADYEGDVTVRDATQPVKSQTVTVEFDKLSAGEYAYKLFHDVNGDGKLNTDMLGIPKEPYYFSQDASDPFSAPEWDEAKFLLPAGTMKRAVEIN